MLTVGTLEASPKTSKAQMFGRILLGLMLVYTGVSHLTFARQEFQAQVPKWIPLKPDLVVFLSDCRKGCSGSRGSGIIVPVSTLSKGPANCSVGLC